jgi:hypothetical protein
MASMVAAGTAGIAMPANARGWTYTGPHGATVTHWGGPRGGYWGRGPCCFGGGVVAGLAVGTAVGAAVARPVVPPPVVYAPPPVVYAPGGYYYVP